MKKIFIFVLFVCGWFTGEDVFAQKEMPNTNELILEFAKKNEGKKIGNGQCWSFAAAAKQYATSPFGKHGSLDFGTVINRSTTSVLPGDIIQFLDVTYKSGNKTLKHTAIIIEVKGKKQFVVADQNVNNIRSVGFRNIDLAEIVEGSVYIFRPYPMKEKKKKHIKWFFN